MQGVHITNEIGHLKAVLVHRPGTETQNFSHLSSWHHKCMRLLSGGRPTIAIVSLFTYERQLK